MTEKAIWNTFNFVRNATLKEMDGISESAADVVPEGFNNNIRWNFGHILTIYEQLFSIYAGLENKLPEHYAALFTRGTKPADWNGELPSIAALQDAFQDQFSRIKAKFDNQVSLPLQSVFKLRETYEVTTVGELLIFSMYHEGLHIGVIKGLKRTV